MSKFQLRARPSKFSARLFSFINSASNSQLCLLVFGGYRVRFIPYLFCSGPKGITALWHSEIGGTTLQRVERRRQRYDLRIKNNLINLVQGLLQLHSNQFLTPMTLNRI